MISIDNFKGWVNFRLNFRQGLRYASLQHYVHHVVLSQCMRVTVTDGQMDSWTQLQIPRLR